ncbi:MAG: C-GCAxxG-C-C family protein [Halodesulfurarchaeum sp.]
MPEKTQESTGRSPSAGRRGFLAGAGTVAGLAMLGNASALSSGGNGDTALAATDGLDKPLPYKKLDPADAKPLGRKNYHAGMHCGQGSFDAVVTLLREKVGGPWNDVPTTAAYWSAGGGAGWSATCGAVVGSNSAISLVHGSSGTTMKLADEQQRWYTQHSFPQYTPPGSASGITKELPTSTSGSILCHESVTKWCQASGYASGSAERSERCSRLAGETAAHAIELLNAEADGNFKAVADATTPSSVSRENGCRSCHYKGTNFEQGQFTRGKMSCLQGCHSPAPHMPDSLK